MGQKVNPHGLRVGVIKDWDSRWYAPDASFGDTLVEDYKLRKYLKKRCYDAGVPRIEIERVDSLVRVNIYCAKPGIIIGKGGAEIEKLRQECAKMLEDARKQVQDILADGAKQYANLNTCYQADYQKLQLIREEIQRLEQQRNDEACEG